MKPAATRVSVARAALSIVLALGSVALVIAWRRSTASHRPPMGRPAYAEGLDRLARAVDPFARYDALIDACKLAYDEGDHETAGRYAEELLWTEAEYSDSRNVGNAVHDANAVLGRIALVRDDLREASRRLLLAGEAESSPSLLSFGSNVSLARDLLMRGEQKVVLEYLQLCRRFWKHDGGKLDRWVSEIRAGRVPEFGTNLLY